MRISKKGRILIQYFEGLKLKAYLCPANVWTIGYGHTKTAKEGMVIMLHEAESLFTLDIKEFEEYINNLVTITLKQYQFDALVSWIYNLGPTNFLSSTLFKRLKENDLKDIPKQIKRWDKAGGKKLRGLTLRREAEAKMFQNEEWIF